MNGLDSVKNWDEMARNSRYRTGELAKLCHKSIRHLERFFRDTFQKTPKCWITNLRMNDAADLLWAGDSFKDISFKLSFKNVDHFYKAFKAFYGCTPTTFLTSPSPSPDKRDHPPNA